MKVLHYFVATVNGNKAVDVVTTTQEKWDDYIVCTKAISANFIADLTTLEISNNYEVVVCIFIL
jgi:hypothetical protein